MDENDYGREPRLLFYIEDAIQDGVVLPNGNKRIISKHVHFVELKEDDTAANAGYAPYLDYRGLTEEEFPVQSSDANEVSSFLVGTCGWRHY